MTPERFQQIRELFESALTQDSADREAWLIKACAGDETLLEAVRRMLVADAQAEGGNDTLIELPEPMAEQIADDLSEQTDALRGKRYGPYTLIRTLGQGGMGQVYLAERSDGSFRQEVAIKTVRAGWDHQELLERFRRERQILASLNHPNIARLLDGGASESGEPYLVMEYVEGVSIGEYCDQERLSIPARLRLFGDVCAAVGYAHQRLVVHRDLKPSNILVTRDGTVKLLDFGIARLLAADAAITAPRDRMFTMGYAAPEQIRGEIPSVSVDVYALGLLLYELLSGQRAYGRTSSTPAAYEREVLTVEPMPPSRAADDLTASTNERAASRGLQPAQLAQQLSGDLDAIVMRALRKEPEARYASVREFAEDISAFLDHRPVQARRGNRRYRMARFVQRHALAVGLGAAALVSLIGGLGVSLWQAEQARIQRDLAQAEARNSRAVADFMVEVFGAADPAMVDGADLKPRDLLAQGARRLGEDNELDAATRSALRRAIGSAQLGISEYEPGLAQMQAAVNEAVSAKDPLLELEARLGLGVALNKLNRSPEAMAEYERARVIADRLAELDPKTDEEIDYFRAIEFGQMDRKDEAAKMLQSVYDRRLARLGAGEPLTIQAATTLAYYLGNLQRVDQGLAVSTPNYLAARANAGVPKHRLKDIVSAHAYLLLLGKRPEAQSLFEEARAIDEQVYGKGHPGTVVSINNLAFAISSSGDPGRAAAIVEETITIRRGMNIEHHGELAFSLINAASMWRKAGEFEKAIERAREGIAIYVARNDGFHRQAQKGRWSLALALEGTGQWREALREITELLPYTDGRSKEFGGADSALPWLVAARLEAKLHAVDPACTKARRVLTIETIEETLLEARVLLAMCQAKHGDDLAARDTLPVLTADDSTLAKIDPFVREWFVNQIH